MKLCATMLSGLLLIATQALGAGEEFAGTFTGTDKNEVSGCYVAGYNGKSVDPWTVTLELRDGEYKGKGSASPGEFTLEGKIKGQSVTGVYMGVNKANVHWTGEFTATLEGDILKFVGKGSVGGGSGCKFNSEVTATRS